MIWFIQTKYKHGIKVPIDSKNFFISHLSLMQYSNKQKTTKSKFKDILLVYLRNFTLKKSYFKYMMDYKTTNI